MSFLLKGQALGKALKEKLIWDFGHKDNEYENKYIRIRNVF